MSISNSSHHPALQGTPPVRSRARGGGPILGETYDAVPRRAQSLAIPHPHSTPCRCAYGRQSPAARAATRPARSAQSPPRAGHTLCAAHLSPHGARRPPAPSSDSRPEPADARSTPRHRMSCSSTPMGTCTTRCRSGTRCRTAPGRAGACATSAACLRAMTWYVAASGPGGQFGNGPDWAASQPTPIR